MRLISRYILFELVKLFGVSLLVMTLLINLALMAVLAVRHGLGAEQFLLLTPYVLPQALTMTIPATMLFAACSVYGRMSGDNEIVALKSAGVSPLSLLAPCFLLATGLSLSCVWLNDMAVSWGRNGAKRVVLESFEEIAYRMLETQHAYRSEKFSIAVRGVQGRKLIWPELTIHLEEAGQTFSAAADEAEISTVIPEDAPGEGKIRIELRNVVGRLGDVKYGFQEKDVIELDLEDGARKVAGMKRASEMAIREIGPAMAETNARLDELKSSTAVESSFGLLTGDFDALVGEGWANSLWQLRHLQNNLAKLRTEPPRRWANGFSCLCFALIGAAVAVRLRNADFLTSFFACFLPILLLYYPLMAFGVDQAKGGATPLSVWLANAAAVAAGFWQLRKVIRY